MKYGVTVLATVVAAVAAFASPPDSGAQRALATRAAVAYNAKNWQEAETGFKQLVAAEPANWGYQKGLADSQFHLGEYDDALASYDIAIPLAEKDAKGSGSAAANAKSGLADMLTSKGNVLLKLKKNPEAIAVFEQAVKYDAHPARTYFNLCAVAYNSGQTQQALTFCDKTIAADPKKADAYFIKGSLLVGESTTEGGKIVPPAGAVKALKKYLALEPNGPHADDVKQMLDVITK